MVKMSGDVPWHKKDPDIPNKKEGYAYGPADFVHPSALSWISKVQGVEFICLQVS